MTIPSDTRVILLPETDVPVLLGALADAAAYRSAAVRYTAYPADPDGDLARADTYTALAGRLLRRVCQDRP